MQGCLSLEEELKYLFLEELYFIEYGRKEIFPHVFSFSVGVVLVVTYLTLLDGFLAVAGTSHSKSGLEPTGEA